MNKNKKSKWLMGGVIALFFVLFFPHGANAATLNLFSSKDTLAIGDTFTIDLKIDSEGVGINAAQSTLQFSKELVNVTNIDKTDSVFNFWLTEPSFDNTVGTVNFIGGSSNGFSGKSLQVIKVTFKVIGSGTINLSLNDAAVTASDGSGTNVLTATKGIELSSLPKSVTQVIVPSSTNPTPEIVPNAPAKPVITILLYPNPSNWYNVSSNFIVSWILPKDITDVSTSLDKIPSLNPTTSEGLFDNKSFPPLGNGVSYLHVRFKNNIGWGATSNYRIAVDTQPPLAFQLDINGGPVDNPTPTIKFISTDSFSGIESYSIQIDGGEAIVTTKNYFTVTDPLSPGQHTFKVIARDRAGNTEESLATQNITPIASPKIVFTDKNIYIGENSPIISGSSLPNVKILSNLLDSDKKIIDSSISVANIDGFWSVSMNKPFKIGSYYIEITAKDQRGALSLPVISELINVMELPALTIAGLNITYKWLWIFLIFVMLVSFVVGFFIQKFNKESRQRRILIAQRDINFQLLNIQKEITKIIEKHKGSNINQSIETEINHILEKIEADIDKNKKYILENLQEIE